MLLVVVVRMSCVRLVLWVRWLRSVLMLRRLLLAGRVHEAPELDAAAAATTIARRAVGGSPTPAPAAAGLLLLLLLLLLLPTLVHVAKGAARLLLLLRVRVRQRAHLVVPVRRRRAGVVRVALFPPVVGARAQTPVRRLDVLLSG